MEAAFFDLDKTVIAKASMVAFGRPFYREGLISRGVVVRAVYGQLVYLYLGASEEKLARIRNSVLALTRGWDRARVRAIVAETLETIVTPIIYREALDLIRRHMTAGRAVFIVSASPEEIVAPLAGFLGVEGAVASRASVDEQDRYTGEMGFYAYGPHKAQAIRELAADRDIDLSASYAYSDSITDLPMLELVGHPVVVNPDRELLRLARARHWEVRRFVGSQRLRGARPSSPSRPALAAGAALTGLAGGWVWWKLRATDG